MQNFGCQAGFKQILVKKGGIPRKSHANQINNPAALFRPVSV